MSFKSKILYVFVALLLLSGITGIQKARACHWASGDMYATYIGAGLDGCSGTTEYKYRISLILYFACQGCTLDVRDSTTVAVFDGDVAYTNPDPLTGGLWWIKETNYDTVTQVCPNYYQDNSCLDLNNAEKYPAYKMVTFEMEITLPYPRTDWNFRVSGGGRPNPKNINGGGNLQLTTSINNLNKYNNSSPKFAGDPLRYICVNQPASFLNEPYDPNGDSLVVSQTYSSSGAPIPFINGYSLANPLPSDPNNPYKVDPVTGTVTFTPTQTGTFQLAFRIDKYERGTGVYLGYTIRDFNLQVLDCAEPPPAVDPVPISMSDGKVIDIDEGRKALYTCPQSNFTFSVNSTAQLSTSQLYLEASISPKMAASGAAFSAPANGTSSVTGTFTWSPTIADIGDHILTITSKDSTCTGSGYTIVQKTSTVFLIRVSSGINLGPDIPFCAINRTAKQLYVQGGEFLKLQWEEEIDGVIQPVPNFLSNPTILNPKADPNKNVTYRVYTPDLVAASCKNRDTMLMIIDTITRLDAFPDDVVVLCNPDYLQMDARLGGQKPTGNLACGETKSPIKCTDPTIVNLFGTPSYGLETKYDTIGSSTPVFPNNVKSAKMQYLIPRQEMTRYGFRSGSLSSLSFDVTYSEATTGAVHPYENFRILLGCTQLKTLNPADGFEKDNKLVEVYNSGATTPLTFPVGTHKFDFKTAFNWDTTQNLIVVICYTNSTDIGTCANPKGNAPGLRFVPTEYTSGLFYKPADNVVPTVCDVLTSTDIESRTARPKFTFTYCEAPGTDFRFWWNPGALLSDSSIQQPLAYIPRTTKYMVETFGRSGCILRDSVMVYVPVNDYNVTPFDSSICYGAEAILRINGTIGGGHLYKWYEYNNGEYKLATSVDCNTCREVRANPLSTTHYKIGVYDSVFCIDTIDAIVKVLPRPEVKLLTRDTVIRYGQSIQLMASGARQYSWIPSGSLSTPNTSAPLATPTEPTSYVVSGIGANGCRSFDTVRVDIDYRDNILVPTAFSPNGDGKNDVFRVANLTFQRIMEFRVFNRWGQEIYTTNDIKGGWDGTWKGEPQPVDNYRYIIRVAFPDGIVETYKGDVTLIR